MKFADEIKFKFWGFSSTRLVLVLNILFFLYLAGVYSPWLQNLSATRELLAPAGGLLEMALIFCFLPPYSKTKFYLCWPLTGLAMLILMLLIPL